MFVEAAFSPIPEWVLTLFSLYPSIYSIRIESIIWGRVSKTYIARTSFLPFKAQLPKKQLLILHCSSREALCPPPPARCLPKPSTACQVSLGLPNFEACLAGPFGPQTKIKSSKLALANNKINILNSVGHPFVSFLFFLNPGKEVGCYLLDFPKGCICYLVHKNIKTEQ